MRYIFLVGIMGCGKTFWGRKLADRLGFRFCDTDEMITEKAGQSISDIFRERGEAAFRKMETELLQHGLPAVDCIIATGGGMPCFGDNMQVMMKKGIVIWLAPAVQIITERIWKTREKRPLIASAANKYEVEERLKNLLKQREAYYKLAHLSETKEVINLEDLIGRIESVGKFALGKTGN